MEETADEWDFFYTTRGDADASILVNLALRQRAPDPMRPWRLSVKVKVQDPTPKGMNSAQERPTLDEIHDDLTTALGSDCDAVFAGRMVRGGVWDFVYYGPIADRFDNVVDATMARFSDYKYSREATKDADWAVLFAVLLPSAREFQQIMNRRVVENLKRLGDDLTVSRDVRHWVYFKNAFDRSRFVDAVVGEFKTFESELPDDGKHERRFWQVLSRKDFVDLGSIHDLALALFDSAAEYDGHYDGWETQVLKATGQ